MNAANIPAVPKGLKFTAALAARLYSVVTHPNTRDQAGSCERIIAGWAAIKGSEKDALMAYGAAVLAAIVGQ